MTYRCVSVRRGLAAVAAVLVTVVAMGAANVAAQELRPPSEAVMQRVREAMPEKATIEVESPRKLLVFWRCEGFFHDSIPLANETLKLMGEMTGAFSVVLSNDMDMFDADTLNQFDGVVLNNTTQLKFENPEHRKALIDFVKGGKALIGIHGATDNFPTWPEGQELIGGVFDGHPWNAGREWAIKIDEPNHILNQGFEGKAFLLNDEIYQVKGDYSREKYRVLLSLDMTNPRNLGLDGIRSNDIPITWIKPYGEGRVFYCSLGHTTDVFVSPAILRHYLDGIQYALGDLKADDSPSAALTPQPVPALTTSPGAADDPYSGLSTYEFGQDRSLLATIEARIREAGAEELSGIESAMIALVGDESATYASRQFACRMLNRLNSEKAVPTLLALVSDKEMSHMARYALQGVASEEVDKALRWMLNELHGDVLIGVIGTLGARGDRQSVSQLGQLASNTDHEIAAAALSALGRIGGRRAAEAIETADIPEPLTRQRDNAYLMCADKMMVDGEFDRALAIYRLMSETGRHSMTRVAAYGGIVKSVREFSIPMVLGLFDDPDPALRQAAGRFIYEIPGEAATVAFAARLKGMPASAQVATMAVLAARGDKAAGPYVEEALASESAEARQAAAEALARLGSASSVPLLARASAAQGAEGRAAASALGRVSGSGVREALIACLSDEQAPVRQAVATALRERMDVAAEGALYEALEKETEGSVRSEMIRGLGALAGADRLADLTAQLVKVESDSDAQALEEAIAALIGRMDDVEAAQAPLLAALKEAGADRRPRFVALLGRKGGDAALEALREVLAGDHQETRRAVARTLADWPDTAPTATLLEIVKTQEDPIARVLALRGYVAMVRKGGESPAQALTNMEPFLTDEALRQEPQLAYVQIASILSAEDPEAARAGLEKALEVAQSEDVKNQANQVLRDLDRFQGFIVNWMMTGLYRRDNLSGAELLDAEFAPETDQAADEKWEKAPIGLNENSPWMKDFIRILGQQENDCVIYLKTTLVADADVEAVLEVGSDDGVKIWLNGDMIHRNNAARPVNPGDDKTPVQLKAGENPLLVKVSNGSADYGFCARLVTADGAPVDGVKADASIAIR